jgi:hypothetical protein
MVWVPVAAWCFAAVVALVVLGFCGYEVAWKARRLQRDVRRLQDVAAQLPDLQRELATAQQRIAAAGLK